MKMWEMPFLSTLGKKLSAKQSTCDNVSNMYYVRILQRKEKKKIKTRIYFVFLSSSHKMYSGELENTFCREFHKNWKISGKIRTKENRNSRDLGDHQIQPTLPLCH